MSLQVEKLEHNMAKLTIEVSEDKLEKALQEAADMLTSDQVSICAPSKVIDYEIFADKENKYNEILKMKLAGEILK